MRIEEIRSLFPHTREVIYLNHAATSPLSTRVVGALGRFIEQRHQTHVDNYAAFQTTIDETRRMAAGLLGVEMQEVDFAPNTSSALNILTTGLTWRSGDRIVVPGCEFPANVHPFLNLARQGVAVEFLPHRDGVLDMEAMERILQTSPRLLSVSWVQFLSGYQADLKQIGEWCRKNGVLFCVDGIQGLGAMKLPDDLNTMGVDFFAAGSHKWMMGTQGLAIFSCSRRLQHELQPSQAGWLSGPVDWDHFFDYKLLFHPDARRFRTGTMNHLGIAGLHAAMSLYLEIGPERCQHRILKLADRLDEGLQRWGLERYGRTSKAYRSGIRTYKTNNPQRVMEHLDENGIKIALRNRLLRFSPTWYNTEEEIDRVLEVVRSRPS